MELPGKGEDVVIYGDIPTFLVTSAVIRIQFFLR